MMSWKQKRLNQTVGCNRRLSQSANMLGNEYEVSMLLKKRKLVWERFIKDVFPFHPQGWEAKENQSTTGK